MNENYTNMGSNEKNSTIPHKRQRTENEDLSSNGDNWPRFLVMKQKRNQVVGMTLDKLSPFATDKGLRSMAGTPKSVKRLRGGNLLVEFSKKQHSENLLKISNFVGCRVSVEPHQSMNFSKGVVRCRDFRNMSEEDILEELKPQDVIHVRQIMPFRNGTKVPSDTYVLTFRTPKLPTLITAGYMKLRVDLYIPNPLRCFNCHRYGHTANYCDDYMSHFCLKCGEKGHTIDVCKKENPTCVNCKGPHQADSKDCPVWIKQKKIVKVKCAKHPLSRGKETGRRAGYRKTQKLCRCLICI